MNECGGYKPDFATPPWDTSRLQGLSGGGGSDPMPSREPFRPKWSPQQGARIAQDRFCGTGQDPDPPCKMTTRVRSTGGEKNKRAGHRSRAAVKDKWRHSGAYSFLDPLLVAGIGRHSQLSQWACTKLVTP